MLELIITLIVIIFTTCFLLNLLWKYHISKLSFIPSAPYFPWLGTAPCLHKKPHLLFRQILKYSKDYDHLYTLWFAHIPVIISSTVEYSEAVLSSKDMLKKSTLYWPLLEWLGTGLLTSYGSKWKQRRRAITLAFHFTILNDFVEIFTQKAESLVAEFMLECDSGRAIDIQLPVSLATLNVICETAMGVNTHTQKFSNSEYANAVLSMNGHIQKRVWNTWLWPKFIYQFTSYGKSYYKDLHILHEYTINVINKRIESRKVENIMKDNVMHKVAFLDMLLDLYDKGEIDVEGIREEVDTFMFAGHDTTAAGLSWIIYLLGRYPKVQEKLHQEVDKIDKINGCCIDQIKECKHLEYVIKESLRLHPPVPLFARVLEQDTKIDGHIVPKGTEIGVFVKALHLNPKYWNEPEKFNPDRFYEDSFLKRNPYAYVPFSAGSRNCIGQRFAMLEKKIFLYHIMSKFRVESVQQECEVEESFELTHRSTNGLFVKFYPK